jgi:deazaflavin-dependent oxidoreductase (nitroreductase family)
MSTSLPPDFNAQVITEFRDNAGVVGGMFEGMTLLLLHDKGATNPAWYHNLKAHPDVRIEVGTESLDVTASELTGDERERVFRAQAKRAPQFADYEKNTDRVIPVIALTPKQES